MTRKLECADASTVSSRDSEGSPAPSQSPSISAADTHDIWAEDIQDSPPSTTLQDINVRIGDLRDLLFEWTETWGPVKCLWERVEEPAIMNGTVDEFKAELVSFVARTRERMLRFHLEDLAMVDLDGVDLRKLRGSWVQALRLMEKVLIRLAEADAIINTHFVRT